MATVLGLCLESGGSFLVFRCFTGFDLQGVMLTNRSMTPLLRWLAERMVDNCKTGALAHAPGIAPVFNSTYVDFCPASPHHDQGVRAAATPAKSPD